MTIPRAEIQTLEPGKLLTFFDLDASVIPGGGFYRYQPMGANALAASVIWRGQVYTPMPIQAEGFEMEAGGSLPRPKLTVGNLNGVIGALVRDLDDLVGARVTCYQILEQHLDSVNFPGGNPTADPDEILSEEVWLIEQKKEENPEAVIFELIAASDSQGHRLPASPMQATICAWNIGDEAICSYVGTCTKTLADCKANHGAGNPLPARMFPGMKVLS